MSSKLFIHRIADRFWSKVDIKGEDDCWVWKGTKFSAGKTAKTIRGYFYYCGHTWRAHRIAWMLANCPIPKGKYILHKCDNSTCVNPDHLYLGTAKDNVRDKVCRNRQYKKITDDAVKEIRALAKKGKPRKDIARQFGISYSYVSAIINKQSRKHLSKE